MVTDKNHLTTTTIVAILTTLLLSQTSQAFAPTKGAKGETKFIQNQPPKKLQTIDHWDDSPNNQSLQLDNKYFLVSYPKCFAINGEGGDLDNTDDPKLSPSVVFTRGQKCPAHSTSESTLSIAYDGETKITSAYDTDSRRLFGVYLLEQNILINQIPAVFIASVYDSCDTSGCAPKLRIEIDMICKKMKFYASMSFSKGQKSLELIKKEQYSVPDDFKQIISSFKCK